MKSADEIATRKQHEILSLLNNYEVKTYRDLRIKLGLTSNQSVADRISALVKKGYLVYKKGSPCGVEITQKGKIGETNIFDNIGYWGSGWTTQYSPKTENKDSV